MRVMDWLLLASVMAACIPLPTNTNPYTNPNTSRHVSEHNIRATRAIRTRKYQPSFLYLLGQFFGQTIYDSNRALGNITRIFNDQFTTTTPSPDMVTEDDSNSTTMAPPPPITRNQLFKILGNNYRGLVRLFNSEWSSAVEQSYKNVASFRKELHEAVRPFLLPNGTTTKTKSKK